MATSGPFKTTTRYIPTNNVKEYRETIPECVNDEDVVLEIGCEWGSTSALIAPHCRELIATDLSPVCIERARRDYPSIRFEELDVFDITTAQAFDRQFTKIYIDVSGFSGYRSLLDTISLLQMYATILQPDTIVIKSNSLKHFASCCRPWYTEWGKKKQD
jgi:trans-aconitate methyltransferase